MGEEYSVAECSSFDVTQIVVVTGAEQDPGSWGFVLLRTVLVNTVLLVVVLLLESRNVLSNPMIVVFGMLMICASGYVIYSALRSSKEAYTPTATFNFQDQFVVLEHLYWKKWSVSQYPAEGIQIEFSEIRRCWTDSVLEGFVLETRKGHAFIRSDCWNYHQVWPAMKEIGYESGSVPFLPWDITHLPKLGMILIVLLMLAGVVILA